MTIRLLRICCLLSIVCGLFATSAAPTLASDVPMIATPKTYRYHADIALSPPDSAATGYADGEIDLVRQAFHLTIVAEEDEVKIRQELILLDSRLYIHSEVRQRWEYVDVRAGQTPEGLPETTLPALKLPEHPTAPYQRVGEETVGGAATNKWRAAGPYNVLLPIISPRTFSGILIEEMLSAEALIGAANNYLYRLTVEETGTITELSDRPNPPRKMASTLAYTYGNFDQSVTITAPAGAVPAPEDFIRSTPDRGNTSLLARASQFATLGGAERIIQILLPAGFPRP